MARSGSRSDKTVGVVACPGLERGADESFGRHGASLPPKAVTEPIPRADTAADLGEMIESEGGVAEVLAQGLGGDSHGRREEFPCSAKHIHLGVLAR